MTASIPDEQASLLAAIVANPDDDTARLVYADWLQENGDEEQAKFIRMGIEYAQLEPFALKRKPLFVQIRDDGRKFGRRWLKPFGVTRAVPTFDRGLTERVEYDRPNDFFAEVDGLCRHVPVRSLSICAAEGETLANEALHWLSQWPEMIRFHSLQLEGTQPLFPTHEGWIEFFGHARLSNLRSLSLAHCAFTDRDVEVLTSTPTTSELVRLDLSWNEIGVAGVRAILDSQHLSKLQEFRFIGGFDGGGWTDEEELLIAELFDRFGEGFDYARESYL